jgi:hypothetical protein
LDSRLLCVIKCIVKYLTAVFNEFVAHLMPEFI